MGLRISWNFGSLDMFSQDCCINSRTGIVLETEGYLDDENDCVALAGSCEEEIYLQ
jgi:hypothetical protein